MILVSLLVASVVQYFCQQWQLTAVPLRAKYNELSAHWLQHVKGGAWLRAICCLLPVWIVLILIIAFCSWVMGPIVHVIIVLFVVWHAVVLQFGDSDEAIDSDWMWGRVEATFVPIFWYALLGLPALIFIYLLRGFRDDFEKDVAIGADHSWCWRANPYSAVLSVLAWLPLRLVILSLALVGDFVATIKAFGSHWADGFMGMRAILWQVAQAAARPAAVDDSAVPVLNTQMHSYCQRVQIVWLLVIAVFTLGYWLA